MSRKYQTVAAVSLFTVVACALYYFWEVAYADATIRNDSHGGNLKGSEFITKGRYAEDKVVVLAVTESENASWVDEDLPDWQNAIYHVNDPAAILHVPRNKGRESMAYFTFIVDHYDHLPEIMVFLHPHKSGWPQAWHTDANAYDNVNSVRSLQLGYVRKNGYANMRCIWNPGCPVELTPLADTSGDSQSAQTSRAYGEAWIYMFGGDNSTVPQTVASRAAVSSP